MSVEFKDYYRVLGLTSSTTDDDIKKAFRKLARLYHPDVAKDKKSAEEKFKEINEANEVLGNPESRKKFDQLGADWNAGSEARPQSTRTWGQATGSAARGREDEFEFEGTGFSDFFEQFFGGRTGTSRGSSPFNPQGFGRSQRPPEQAMRGEDIQGDILITLDEVLKGAMRSISVKRTRLHGTQDGTETYQVRIPKGVLAGQTIRVSGKGGEGAHGGQAGDIFLHVRYAQHPDWQVRGTDLIGHLDLAPWEAVLGATVPVRTFEGDISIKVPPGFQQGQKLRVRGRGLPAGAARRGDLYVEVSIHVPSLISQEERLLWENLAKVSNYKPRDAS